MDGSADIGVIGLAVMGQNLILNMDEHGFKVCAYNRSVDKVERFLAGPAAGTNIVGATSLSDFVGGLSLPRKVMLMVRAGEVVDQLIEQLIPLLESGDIIIDGGNSNFEDTSRRVDYLESKGFFFLGVGVSGGEEGARHGPSIMPGGSRAAWPQVQHIFQAIAAKTSQGEACCDWVGEGGAGHFVKMVHNGIEYGDMQLIAEVYHFMKSGLGIDNDEMASLFAQWNTGELESYLIEITAEILKFKDDDGSYLVENILDKAGQKGTGKWTGINALDLGVPLTMITESVFARCISALKGQRRAMANKFNHPAQSGKELDAADAWLSDLKQALLASKIISYAQGFMLMKASSEEHEWDLEYGNVALMWREGCIIRSAFLENIRDAYDEAGQTNASLDFLGAAPFFNEILNDSLPAWRRVVAKSIEIGLPMPCMSSALVFLDGYRSESLPANLIQAQRDYFGAHTYQRKDDANGAFFHTDWTGEGGDAASSTYDV